MLDEIGSSPRLDRGCEFEPSSGTDNDSSECRRQHPTDKQRVGHLHPLVNELRAPRPEAPCAAGRPGRSPANESASARPELFQASKVLHRTQIRPIAIHLCGVPFFTYVVWISPRQSSLGRSGWGNRHIT